MIVCARTVRFALPLAMAGALLACKDDASSGGSVPAASASAATLAAAPSASVSAAPVASAAPPAPCTAAAPFVIDKGGRLDTGLTSVEFENGKQIAVGYAVGDGTPRVAMIDETGTVTKADPDWSHVKDQEAKKDPAMVRHLYRVTPLGVLPSGKMRVGMDLKDEFPEKGKGSYLRCGPAEVEPVISDDSGSPSSRPRRRPRSRRSSICRIPRLPARACATRPASTCRRRATSPWRSWTARPRIARRA